MTDFRHVTDWVFDLDNTLYPAECQLFRQIDQRMTGFVSDLLELDPVQARKVQKDLYSKYGTTLSGLMKEYRVKPEEFMDYVHDIDVSTIQENADLNNVIASLPGRKFIFTNGSTAHAENIAGKLGILRQFDAIFDIKAADYVPKPHRETYETFLKNHNIQANSAAMFEDLAVNLEAPDSLGMTTVLICSEAPWPVDEPAHKRPARLQDKADHVHHRTSDLTGFLSGLMTAA